MQTRKYKWKKKEVDQSISLRLAKELNVSKVVSEILVARGIYDFDSAQNYFRPNEVDNLKGDFKKARQKLGWKPKTSFEDMITEMVNEDIKKLK